MKQKGKMLIAVGCTLSLFFSFSAATVQAAPYQGWNSSSLKQEWQYRSGDQDQRWQNPISENQLSKDQLTEDQTVANQVYEDQSDRKLPYIFKRFFGQNRFETSIAIAKQLYNGQQVQNVVLASAYSFPDALAASTLAYKLKAPIILAGNGINESMESLSFIKSHLVSGGTVTIIGGTGVIRPIFEQWLLNQGFQVTRFGGSNRYATDAAIVKQLNVAQGTPIFIANGNDFPDALGISSVAASKGYPILLSGPSKLPQSVQDFVYSDQPSTVYLVGGTGVMHDSLASEIQAASPNTQIQRIGGTDRFATLATILNTFYPDPSTIYVANGMGFADALSGSQLAASTNSPIVLINPRSNNLPPAIKDYLQTLKNNGVQPQVNVLGGDGAVPERLVDKIDAILQGSGGTTTQPTASETLTVSDPTTTGFTVALNPVLNDLTASNFTLLDSSGNPVSITGVTTSDNGETYAISAALTAGQTYTVTATDTGYTFGTAQSVVVPN